MKKLLVLLALVAGISVMAIESAQADHRRSSSRSSRSVFRTYSYPSYSTRSRGYYSPYYNRFGSRSGYYGYSNPYYRSSGFSIQFGRSSYGRRGFSFGYCR